MAKAIKRRKALRPSSIEIIGPVQKVKNPLPSTANRIVKELKPIAKSAADLSPRRFRQKIISAIRKTRLTARQRAVLLQRLDGATFPQIAKAWGITASAVREFETRALGNILCRWAN